MWILVSSYSQKRIQTRKHKEYKHKRIKKNCLFLNIFRFLYNRNMFSCDLFHTVYTQVYPFVIHQIETTIWWVTIPLSWGGFRKYSKPHLKYKQINLYLLRQYKYLRACVNLAYKQAPWWREDVTETTMSSNYKECLYIN